MVEDILVFLTIELCCISLTFFEVIEEFQEEYPRYLLGIVHSSRDAIISAEDIGDAIDVLLHSSSELIGDKPACECLFEETLLQGLEISYLRLIFLTECASRLEYLIEMCYDLVLASERRERDASRI